MQTNVGTIDRTLRIAAGSILVILAVTGQVGAWGWLGVVPMATGLLRWCPAYLPFGLSTCKTR
ncbi:MAG: DUF2892 domain-containing protein [Burkholderiales bacterium]|nr:DUF2892 domain-containing protein [Burkholderiales bacterium]MBH2017918.1 DUF2892 domain-containing protein [Burkholderiales bacterium]